MFCDFEVKKVFKNTKEQTEEVEILLSLTYNEGIEDPYPLDEKTIETSWERNHIREKISSFDEHCTQHGWYRAWREKKKIENEYFIGYEEKIEYINVDQNYTIQVDAQYGALY